MEAMYYASKKSKPPTFIHYTQAFGKFSDGSPVNNISSKSKTQKLKQVVKPKGIKVYCAGPMFSVGDKHEMDQICEELETSGYDCYLPHRDGLELGELLADIPLLQFMKNVSQLEMEYMTYFVQLAIFSLDIYYLLKECQIVVMNCNGRVPDEGACCESSIAFASGLPIIQYKEDPRSKIWGRDNPILGGLFLGPVGGFDYCRSVEEIPERVEKTAKFYKKNNSNYDYIKQGHIPPIIKPYIYYGEKIKANRKTFMDSMDKLKPKYFGLSKIEGLKIKLKTYMDFFQSLVLNGKTCGITIPKRFDKMDWKALIALALK